EVDVIVDTEDSLWGTGGTSRTGEEIRLRGRHDYDAAGGDLRRVVAVGHIPADRVEGVSIGDDIIVRVTLVPVSEGDFEFFTDVGRGRYGHVYVEANLAG